MAESDWYRNAGILNKAAWLIGQGGSHNLFTVAGIGRPKLGHLFYTVGTLLHYSAELPGRGHPGPRLRRELGLERQARLHLRGPLLGAQRLRRRGAG
jgi:hypothetical protein